MSNAIVFGIVSAAYLQIIYNAPEYKNRRDFNVLKFYNRLTKYAPSFPNTYANLTLQTPT